MNRFLLSLLLLIPFWVVFSQSEPNKLPKHNISAWNISNITSEIIHTHVDTIPLNYQYSSLPDGNNYINYHLAQYGSPTLSRTFFMRPAYESFIFKQTFLPYLITTKNTKYYNTTIPYTNVSYNSAGGNTSQEELFKVLFTANIGKKLNIGANLDIIYARGFYNSQAANSVNASFWTSYITDRYTLHSSLYFNNQSTLENGGITDDQYITNPVAVGGGARNFEPKNIPTQLTDAYNRIKGFHLDLSHKYNIGSYRTTIKTDSVKKDTIEEFISISSLVHTLNIGVNEKHFVLKTKPVDEEYFDNYYFAKENFTDRTDYNSIKNTLALTLNEGFNKIAVFGLSAYITHELEQYKLMNRLFFQGQGDLKNEVTNHNSIYAGAIISRQQGNSLNFYANASLGLIGYNIGDINIDGHIKTQFILGKREQVTLKAYGHLKNTKPKFLLNHYVSNNFIWDNNFGYERRIRLAGELKLQNTQIYLDGGIENIQNYIYFDNSSKPNQETGNIQVLSLTIGKDFKLGKMHWDNHISLQASSNNDILPLPAITAYSNLYFKGKFAKVLTAQIGIDCRYFSSYKALEYQPALNLYHTQNNTWIGNYPIMNVYANLHLKRTRFFVMYYHANKGLFPSPNYFSSPHNPINPSVLKIGVSWNFLN